LESHRWSEAKIQPQSKTNDLISKEKITEKECQIKPTAMKIEHLERWADISGT